MAAAPSLALAHALPRRRATPPPLGELARRRSILCVDDEPGILRVLSSLFEAEGLHTVVARSSRAAWDACRRQPPSLIVSDIRRPLHSGFDFLAEIRASSATRRMPFVFISGMGAHLRADALAAGADACLQKPFSVEELLALVRSLLRR